MTCAATVCAVSHQDPETVGQPRHMSGDKHLCLL